MPPPEPRSSTLSPALRSMSAVGLPQPREALTASCGTPDRWSVEYRLEVIGSQHTPDELADAGLQQVAGPVAAWRAAAPYLDLMASFRVDSVSFMARSIFVHENIVR